MDAERLKSYRVGLGRRRVTYARTRAHAAFDVIWKHGFMTRSEAYEWLARELGVDEAHMKAMTAEECERVIELSNELLTELTTPTVGHPESFEDVEYTDEF